MQNTTENKRKWWELDSAILHILAMLLMLSDHMWSTLLPSQRWMTTIGRIAFPIFAFMIVEGYFHTKNFKKYMLRMLIFALVAEIPFDLMVDGVVFYPFHQSVMLTFLIALGGMWLIDLTKKKKKLWLTILVSILVVLVCVLLGFLFMVDYFGFGVLTVFVFYFFHGRKWWCFLGQLLLLFYINVEALGGFSFTINLFGLELELVEQGFALLALIPIWLYRGRQGYHSKPFQYFCYAFYPGHMLLLWLGGFLLSGVS